MGITSKGAFLRLAEEQIVFISLEPYRGPLTLNLTGHSGWLDLCRVGDELAIQAGWMRPNSGAYCIDIRPAAAWEAPEISAAALNEEERIAIIIQVAASIRSYRGEAGWTPLLLSLIGLPGPIHTQAAHDPASIELRRLRGSLETGQVEPALAAAETFLGMGCGLTPSGDDLLLGLLLALNRWGTPTGIQIDIPKFNQGILEKALHRTTTLSANLLKCAADGQADERLVAALDGLLTGQPAPEACAAHLIAWGSSSGCDAFAGMAMALLTLSSDPSRSHYAH
jgi:hypothetical protein